MMCTAACGSSVVLYLTTTALPKVVGADFSKWDSLLQTEGQGMRRQLMMTIL